MAGRPVPVPARRPDRGRARTGPPVAVRGYAAVFGTPGSGKSTLLSEALRGRAERVVRYYAYVPDAQGGPLRGESTHFLLDVVLALESQGVRAGAVPTLDRGVLLSKFHSQLARPGEEYRETGRKTILLVDGLDHIQREQSPERSLLADLPPPESVPDGLLIVPGSQTDELDALPTAVQSAVRDRDRRVEMRPLDRDAVLDIIAHSPPVAGLGAARRERVFALSGGHPLALMYLLNRLAGAAGDEAVDAVLDGGARYTGRIETQYDAYWRSLELDRDLRQLLGLLARLRRGFDVRWVESWAGAAVVDGLERTAGHYFRAEGDHRYFLHNSFRIYLEARTAERPRAGYDEARDPDGRKVLVVIADNAGWHVAGRLAIPPDVVLRHLPSCTPELQPPEPLWPLVREALANKAFPTLAALTAPLEKRCGWLAENTATVKGAAGFHWAAAALG